MTSPPANEPISSRPRYGVLEPRPCTAALMICDTQGAKALLALAAAAPGLMPNARILHLCDGGPVDAALRAVNAAGLTEIPTSAQMPAAIDAALSGARMGLQAFLAGSEGLVGMAQARLLAAGLPLGAIQAEHRGSAARRMQCVHCKTIAEGVTLDPYRCPGCGRALYVRDHFSRRLGAFQGVCIDAETPGVVPESVAIRL